MTMRQAADRLINNGRATPWLLTTVLSDDGSLRCDTYFYDLKYLHVDETKAAKYWRADELFLQPETDHEEDVDEEKYVLAYATDSEYLIRTKIDNNLLENCFSGENGADEIPLAYSQPSENAQKYFNSSPSTTAAKKYVPKKFTLCVTKYKFLLEFVDDLTPRMTLIIDNGAVQRQFANNHDLIPCGFSKVITENEKLHGMLNLLYGGEFESTRKMKKIAKSADACTETADGDFSENASRFLSNWISNLTDSNDRFSAARQHFLANGPGAGGKEKDDAASTDSASSDTSAVVFMRNARVQTSNKYTKWDSKLSVREAAKVFYDPTTQNDSCSVHMSSPAYQAPEKEKTPATSPKINKKKETPKKRELNTPKIADHGPASKKLKLDKVKLRTKVKNFKLTRRLRKACMGVLEQEREKGDSF